jgi:hypothetical protein
VHHGGIGFPYYLDVGEPNPREYARARNTPGALGSPEAFGDDAAKRCDGPSR